MAITESKGRVTGVRSNRSTLRLKSTVGSLQDIAASDNEDDGNLETLRQDDMGIALESPITARFTVAPLQNPNQYRPVTIANGGNRRDSLSKQLSSRKRKRPSTMSIVPANSSEAYHLTELQRIEAMVDAAMRISVCNNVRGSLRSLKIKANTFTEGLADVSPALWRPGFRSVRYVRLLAASVTMLTKA
jgi:hypothetical protein